MFYAYSLSKAKEALAKKIDIEEDGFGVPLNTS